MIKILRFFARVAGHQKQFSPSQNQRSLGLGNTQWEYLAICLEYGSSTVFWSAEPTDSGCREPLWICLLFRD